MVLDKEFAVKHLSDSTSYAISSLEEFNRTCYKLNDNGISWLSKITKRNTFVSEDAKDFCASTTGQQTV